MNRRDFVKSLIVAAGPCVVTAQPREDPDYIVVGSGAGGGTVAARLAEAGYSVMVLEAGGDPRAPDPAEYDVPAFHPFSTENAAMRWDFFVRHYAITHSRRAIRSSCQRRTASGIRERARWAAALPTTR